MSSNLSGHKLIVVVSVIMVDGNYVHYVEILVTRIFIIFVLGFMIILKF